MKRIIFLLLITAVFISAQVKDTLVQQEEPFFNRKNISIIGVSGFFTFSLVQSYLMWWKDDHRTFHFLNPPANQSWFDSPGQRGIDKAGHFYTSYFLYKAQKNILTWGGYSEKTSSLISLLFDVSFSILIEVGDGFSSYGFDYQDLVFNLGGAGFGLLQDKLSVFRNINFKWSYFPDKLAFPPEFTEHYDSHIYWMTFNLHNLLPDGVNNYWPAFLQPAIGFSVAGKGSRRELIVGVDLNLLEIFKTDDENWNLFISTAELFHLPLPAIKYSKDKIPEYRLFMLN
ncbi:MAG: DUF2279 domain-containing protein [Ignavibacteriaceae bacterium]|nr:DUF2279 domain-containing protein [Ignavibacteriaceae bacterium]